MKGDVGDPAQAQAVSGSRSSAGQACHPVTALAHLPDCTSFDFLQAVAWFIDRRSETAPHIFTSFLFILTALNSGATPCRAHSLGGAGADSAHMHTGHVPSSIELLPTKYANEGGTTSAGA